MDHIAPRRRAALAALCLLFVVGCGGGGDDDATASSTTEATTSRPSVADATSTTDDGGDDDGDATTTTGGGDATSLPPTTTPATLPDTADELASGTCRGAGTTSPAEFDDAGGTYAVTIAEVTADQVSFDVFQWFVGQDAVDAFNEDNPDAGGEAPPNDVYTRNASNRIRSATAVSGAVVLAVEMGPDGIGLVESSIAHLATDAEQGFVWFLTFDVGRIVEACQQFTP